MLPIGNIVEGALSLAFSAISQYLGSETLFVERLLQAIKSAQDWTGSQLKARWFFVLNNWHELTKPGMNATKAHTLCEKICGNPW